MYQLSNQDNNYPSMSYQSQQNLQYPSSIGQKSIKRRSAKLDNRSNQSSTIMNKKVSNNISTKLNTSSSKTDKNYQTSTKNQSVNMNQQNGLNTLNNYSQISKTFRMFSKKYIDFNQTILALKILGIDFSNQRKFQQLKNIYHQVKRNNNTIDQEQFLKISIRMITQQKNKQNSQLNCMQKAYYYMLQQGNQIQPYNHTSIIINSSKQYQIFKNYVEKLSHQQKYLTKQSLQKLVKYLNLHKQFTSNDVQNICRCIDAQNKGYLNMEDIISTMMTKNEILNETNI